MKKNFFNKLIFLIFISCMFFSNCSFSGDDDNTLQKAVVLLSMNNNAVSPDKVRVNLNFETPRGGTILSTQELRDLIFSGAREGGGICNVTGSTKNELCSKEIWLQTGSWSFELEGTIDGITFKDSVSMNISQINTTIEFNLRPYDGNEAISKGGLYFVLNFSGDADYALLNIKDAVTGTVIETDKKIKGFDVVKKIEYSKTFKGQDSEGLTPGTYKLTVDFYRNDMNTDEPPLNTWEAYARIKAGLTARKEISDFDLTDSYRITYHVPSGATISAAGVVVLCYSRKSDTITLPVYTNAGFKVLSWYETENFNISQPGVTSFNPKTKLKNMDFYPLWDTDTGYVTAGGIGNGLSAELAASSAATALTNLKKLHEYGSEQTNLKIQIDGEVSGNTTIGTDYNYVDSITLKGKTGNSTDSLKGSGSNSVLKLECEKSVTITNLKITGGSGVNYGGGIYVGGKSSVILEDGALIDGNSAAQRGGGIYVSANMGTEGRISLTINDGAKITGNKIVNDGSGEYGGMGIFAESAKIVMNGGEISQNNGQRVDQRGAVRLHNNCVFDLNGGKITNNSVMHIGGNIFCRASTINMTAGEISEGKAGNESQHGAGGGLWIENVSAFNLSGGTICNNSVSQISGSTGGAINLRNDGAKLCISGSAYIPSSGTAFDNDIYIQNKSDNTYPAIEISGELTPSSEYVAAGKKIAVSPAGWNRRQVILKAADDAPTGLNIEDYKNYFCFTSNGVNFSYGTDNTAIIMAPYFVASSGTDDDDTPGDSDNPYRTLKYAVGKLSGNYDETIKIKGILKGASEIPDTFSTTNCKSLTIEGASNLDSDGNPQDVLTIADDAASGSVLKINTEVPVTLKNIKITGGKGTPDSTNEANTFGGGIYFEKGSLTLADGVLITGNSATVSGGGIYMPLRDAKLFMCGTSYVGDKRTTTATGTTVNDAGTNCANFAANSGGGIYSCGKVYLGYIQNSSGNIVPESWTGGICGNAASNGAGITSGRDTAGSTPESGLLKVKTGKISYNYAGSGSGGGIYAYDGTVVEFYNGEIGDNSAENGGAIYADGAATKISVSGGKLSQNTASSCGGAINYNNGTIEVSGSVYIPCTGEKQNDVYLAENKFLTIAGNLTLPADAPSNAKNMVITPLEWTRGNQVLGASSAGLIESNKDRFATIDEDFTVDQKSGETTKGVLSAPIYVASSSTYDDTRYGNSGYPLYQGPRGTRAKPYCSLETALEAADASSHIIYIDGTFTGKTEISSTTLPNTDMLTLRGYIPEGQTVAKATLNGEFSSFGETNTTLIINGAKKVDIYDLTIKGGNNKSSYDGANAAPGGGILINGSAEVTLGSGATITENTACYGGGVSVFNGKLTVNDGAVISKNSAIKNSSEGGYGGGIYVGKNGSLLLAGGMIGDSTSLDNGNKAIRGGGIYLAYNDDDVIRVEMTGGSVSHNLKNSGGSSRQAAGAGLYLCGKASISGGVIAHNITEGDCEGGGIYLPYQSVCTISGTVEISDNSANYGGGICSDTNDLTVEGGIFRNNNAEVAGGAILAYKVLYLKGNPVFYKSGDVIEKHKNDIDLYQYTASIRITGPVTTSDEYVAAVTPHDFKRGERLLSASSENISNMDAALSKFVLTKDNDGWNREKIEPSWDPSMRLYIINSPIYVVGTGHNSFFQDPPASGATGTKNMPYASIFAAEEAMDDSSMDYEVIVDGSITGPQKFSYSDNTSLRANSVSIKGYKPTASYTVTAKLNGNSTGSALTIDAKTADFPVTIQDLTITGGSATNGGGINITKGTVKLTDGAKITGNTATNGGGVYVGSDGTLFMYGKALIGDTLTGATATTVASSLSFANKASYGGGIYSEGNVYLGYNAWGTTSGTAEPLDSGYGVRRNYSTGDYAGIYGSGTVRIKTGNISYNTAASNGGGLCGNFILEGGTVSGNSASNGAGMYIPNGITTSSITNGTVSSNVAENNGGAAYISNGGKLSLSGGTISANEATNGGAVFTYYYTSSSYGTFEMNGGTLSENSATGHGGAVYVDTGALFKMSGSASIPPVLHTTLENYYIVNQNDVYLAKNSDGSERAAITVTGSILLSAESPVAAVTPAECKRGIAIVKNFSSNTLVSGTNEKFAITEYDDDWTKKQASDNKSVTIESDVYVASSATTDSTRKVCGPAPSSGNIGTKHKPYKTISDALTVFEDADALATVIVDGTLTGAQTIGSVTANSLTIKGCTYTSGSDTVSDATLKGGFTSASKGTTLTIDSPGVNSVTVQYLAITGGYAASNGGGVYVKSGSVANLANGVVVKGNRAVTNGGGVYVESGAALGVYGTVTIGKAGATDAPAATEEPSATNGINKAGTSGGGIYNAGELRIGGSVSKRTDGGSGVTGSTGLAGTTEILGNVASSGGGVYATGTVYGGTSALDATKLYSGNIKCNRATNGGGVYIADGKYLYMSGGKFELNKAGTSGGAVYQGGTFNVSGGAQMYVATNAEKTNDVFLPADKYITVSAVIKTSGTPLFSGATITPASWIRGTQVLAKGSSLTSGLTEEIVSKFNISDSEWSPILVGSGTSATGKIDADIWVAGGTLSTGVGNKVTGGKAPSNDNRGTKLQPYATLAKAVAQCWKGPNDTVATTGRTINIDGTVQGSGDNAHTISDTDLTSAKATAVTLLGNGTNGATLSRSAAGGRVLYITSAVPVTIKKLTITGGNTTGTGAGICVSAPNAKLTLGQGAVVNGNEGNGNGGGVYFEGTSTSKMGTLTMESTAKIQGNKSNLNNGGGIYLKYAKLYMRGSALVGDNSTSYTVGATNSSKSNSAVNGGGIYADEYGYVYIGDGTGDSALGASYGVCHNYASSDGGGVYLATSTSILKMGSGKISKNGAAVNGGGVYNAGIVYLYTDALIGDAKFTTSTATATNTAHSNLAGGDGGGIFSVGGSYVGLGYSLKNGSSWTAKTLNDGYGVVGNYAAGSGGGIQCNDNSGSAMELHMASGDISANRANGSSSDATGGGGIHVKNSYTKVEMSGGKIAKNSAVTGGGVHLNGNIYMSGSAAIGDMSKGATTYASSATACSNYASSKGGGVYVYTNGDLSMGYKNAVANNYDTTFSGGIAYNYSSMGGGIYTKASSGVHLAYGTVKSNGASLSGGGVFMTYWLVIGKATIPGGSSDKQNGVCFNTSGSPQIDGISGVAPTESQVAKITPGTYATSTQVLSSRLYSYATKFYVFPKDGVNWSIDSSTGKLKQN